MPEQAATTRALSAWEFEDTCVAPMRDVTSAPRPPVPLWQYVGAVPEGELEGHGLCDAVEQVFRSADGRFDHVAVPTGSIDVFLVVVIDNQRSRVVGHRLLDLRCG
ncbi:MAG TPA: hypothetical protein VGM56_07890 [Byssovorax sp.]|jgi:hypothetical protein